jgi:hypothetical protein
MVRRLLAIGFIFAGTTVAWMILGATIFSRTYDMEGPSRARVESSWGTAQSQSPPYAVIEHPWQRRTVTEKGKKPEMRIVESYTNLPLPLESSSANVILALEHRQKGLLWYSLYKIDFDGIYTFTNSTDLEQRVRLRLKYPARNAIYDDLVFSVDGQSLQLSSDDEGMYGYAKLAPSKTVTVRIAYKSQGQEKWHYSFGENVSQIKNFNLKMHTNFKDIDFSENILSPTSKRETSDGWELEWNYKSLVSGFAIGMVMPEKLQPGPLAGRISFFAPVSLFFFFFLMFVITTLRNIDLHPMNYFFLAAAFFAFHLLLAYTVDHISIHLAFVICSLVSIFLVVSYLRLVVGIRFAAMEAALAQLVYLIFFSYAFFFKGFTGLTVTVIAIITLFVVMQMTGRVDWTERFARLPKAGGKAAAR